MRIVPEAELGTQAGPVVVLGEPGMGKTQLLQALGETDGFRYVTARKLIRSDNPARLLDGGQTLVIDALDEVASATESDPINQVLGQLDKAGFPRFILSCRGADWQGAVGRQGIAEDYGRAPLVLTLLPVSRDEAIEYLTSILDQLRAVAAIKGLEDKTLQVLYGNPLTLTLVGKVVVAEGRLPETRHDLYAKSTELLYKESNPLKGQTRLSLLGADQVLDTAGALCAALLLTGSEAISLEAPGLVPAGDLHLSAVADFPDGGDARAVLGSKLFRRLSDGDRFGPLHRTIAEFLGARWLAGRASNVPAVRLMSLVTYSGGPPSSLRGLHAWLADFNGELARYVIAADPYGVLRYGDPTRLTDASVRRLLEALRRLSTNDPHFRSSDWSQQVAPGLARSGLIADLDRLIFDRKTEFQFRMLLLEAIEGQDLSAALAPKLQFLLTHEGKHPFTFAERRAAGDALIAAPGVFPDWPRLIRGLQFRAGEDPRRLAVELMTKVGTASFTPKQIAQACLSYLNLLPGRPAISERVNTVGVLYFLARQMPVSLIPDVLDQIVAMNPNTGKHRDWETRYGVSELVDTLVARALAISRPAPAKLLSWLRLVRTRDHAGGEQRKEIAEVLRADDNLRRAVQRLALVVATDHGNLFERSWRLGEINAALHPTPEDVVWLLSRTGLRSARSGDLEMLKDLVRISRTPKGVTPAVLKVAEALALKNPEFAAFLVEVRKSRTPDWKRKERDRKRREDKARDALWATHRASYQEKVGALRAGDLRAIYPPAQAYLGRFYDTPGNLSPPERLSNWLGDALSENALAGFEATLHRKDLPKADAVAESYGEQQRWSFVLPLIAGMTERARNGRDYEDLEEDVVIAARLALLHEHVDEASGGKLLEQALSGWFAARPAATERLVRLTIEPQLRHQRGQVVGLYQLVQDESPDLMVERLASGWLRDFPGMDRSSEFTLVAHLLHRGDWASVSTAAAQRHAAGYQDEEHRLSWLAIGFVLDFESHRAELDMAADDRDFLWTLRTWRGETRRKGAVESAAPLASLVWLIDRFRPQYPAAYRSGSSNGDTNAADATDFLLAIIRVIASDISDEGLEAMERLRAAPEDGYSDTIRNARSQQIVKRREADFEPPTLVQVRAVTTGSAPESGADLKAIALDALARVQALVAGDDLNSDSTFYENGEPLDENRCRDRLGILLRGVLPADLDITPERAAPGGTRADLVFVRNRMHVPLEAKGQWHPELWSAAQRQLDARYTRDWRAEGAGIYLVFWFGPAAPTRCKLKGPPRGHKRPTTPEALREALMQRVPEHRRGAISVVVLDLSRSAR